MMGDLLDEIGQVKEKETTNAILASGGDLLDELGVKSGNDSLISDRVAKAIPEPTESIQDRAIRLGAKPGIALTPEQVQRIQAGETIEPAKQTLDPSEAFQPRSSIEAEGVIGSLGLSAAQGIRQLPTGALLAGQELTGIGDVDATRRKAINLKERTELATRDQPVAGFAGQVAGEVAGFPFGGAGKSLLTRAATSAPIAALGGALSEAGRGSEVEQIATSGAIAGALGPAGEVAGDVVSAGASKIRGIFSKSLDDAVDAVTKGIDPDAEGIAKTRTAQLIEKGFDEQAAARQANAETFGTSLTKGQSTRDFTAAELEEALKSQANTPEGISARRFFEKQQQDLISAKDAIISDITEDIGLTRESRGEIVQTTLRDINDQAKAQVSELYKNLSGMEGGNVRLRADQLDSFKDELIGEYAPTERIQNGIDRVFNDFSALKSGSVTTPTTQGPLTFANAEKMRQRLGKLNPVEPSDIAVISQLKDGLDDLVSAASKQFEEGTPIASAALEARKAAADRFKTFKAKDVVQDLIDFKSGTKTDKVPPSQVFDKLFTGNKKLENIRLVRKTLLKNPTKESIKAWKEIQAQGVIDTIGKAVSETPDGWVISGNRLNSSINKFGDDGLKRLLSKDQYSTLKRFQSVVGDATIPVPRTTNPSGTSAKLLNSLARMGAISQGGLVDQVISVGGGLAKRGEQLAQTRATLRGITEGAAPIDRGRSVLEALTSVSARTTAAEQAEREQEKATN